MHCNLKPAAASRQWFWALITRPIMHHPTKFQQNRAVMSYERVNTFSGPFYRGEIVGPFSHRDGGLNDIEFWQNIRQSSALPEFVLDFICIAPSWTTQRRLKPNIYGQPLDLLTLWAGDSALFLASFLERKYSPSFLRLGTELHQTLGWRRTVTLQALLDFVIDFRYAAAFRNYSNWCRKLMTNFALFDPCNIKEGISAMSESVLRYRHGTIPLIYSLTGRCSTVCEIRVWVSTKKG